jgi:signal peptidase II
VTGAIGNGIDYLAYGHVIDFFHFCFWGYSFAIFNLADSYITLGVFALLFLSRFAKCRTVA